MNHNESHLPHVLGVDIGRVIIGTADMGGHADTTFLRGDDHAAMNTPSAAGAFETLRDLVSEFRGAVWLVSKCGPRIQARTRAWLAHHRFFDRTGVRPGRVLFCRRRPDKREHCLAIGATHFIDDRTDVLRHLRGVVPNLYLFGHQTRQPAPRWCVPVIRWADVRHELLPAEEITQRPRRGESR
ncbi:MAG: hypothetical protein AAGF12_30335 [Myxococcota bacterium]